MRWIQLGSANSTGLPDTLVEAVQRHNPVSLLRHGPIGAIVGHFFAIEGNAVVVELPVQDTPFQTGLVLTISFLVEHRVAVFMTQVLSQTRANHRLFITVEIPRSVLTEMRAHPRIRAGKSSELNALIRIDDGIWEPWVGDVSQGGARLCFVRDAPSWNIGTLMRVDLALHHQTATVVAMIIRREPNAIGVRFRPMSAQSPECRRMKKLLAHLEALHESPLALSV